MVEVEGKVEITKVQYRGFVTCGDFYRATAGLGEGCLQLIDCMTNISGL